MRSLQPFLSLVLLVAGASFPAHAQTTRQPPVTPSDPRAVYIVVLNPEKGPEPEFEKGGVKLLARWQNRVVVELPPAAVAAMQKHGRVKYVQHLENGPAPAASTWSPEGRVSSAAVVQSMSGGTLEWSTGEYGYDGSGNIKKVGPGGDGHTRRFVYDELDRLVEAGLEAPAAAAGTYTNYARYTYDSFGNRLTEVTPSMAQTVAADRNTNRITMSGTTITYDGVGNMTRGGGFSYTYDPFNNLKEVYGGPVRKMAIYNASDERIIFCGDDTVGPCRWTLRGSGNEVLREYESAPIGNGNQPWYFLWVEDSVYRGSLLAGAQRETADGGRLHFHLDHLGSPRLITNAAGQKVAENEFAPFGRELTSIRQEAQLGYDRTEPRRFTGHERDFLEGTASDNVNFIDYMHARYYSAKLGRFLSVDPGKDWDPRQPQSWNMYAYVRNNPINTIDPTGKWGWSDFKSWTRDTRADISNWWSEKWHKDIPAPADQYGGVEALEAADLSPADAQQMGNPQANWANARGEAGAILSEQATAEVMTFGVGKVVGVAGVVVFGHGARHLIGTALQKEAVEAAIEKEVQFVSREASQTGSFWGRVKVNGQVIEYRAHTLPDGTINVGTYYAPKP